MNEDKATRYNRLKRQVGIASVVWSVVFLLALVVTGGSALLRDASEAVASIFGVWTRGTTVVVYVVLLTLLNEFGSVPLENCGKSKFTVARLDPVATLGVQPVVRA